MATKTVVKYYSDFSGAEIDDAATVTFGLDGTTYEIDLTDAEQRTLRDLLAPYVDAGRTRTPGRSRRAGAGGPAPREIRAWAVENGHDVPSRGRIPATITEAYRAAH